MSRLPPLGWQRSLFGRGRGNWALFMVFATRVLFLLGEKMDGYLVWVFILVGNAAAFIILSAMTSGGTSAMGNGAPGWSIDGPVRR